MSQTLTRRAALAALSHRERGECRTVHSLALMAGQAIELHQQVAAASLRRKLCFTWTISGVIGFDRCRVVRRHAIAGLRTLASRRISARMGPIARSRQRFLMRRLGGS